MKEILGCNPWFSIWVKPRMTIQHIIDYKPNYRLWWLCAIYGFVSILGFFQTFSFGYFFHFYGLIVFSVIFSFICGYVIFSIIAFFMYFVGKWFKGKATFKQVRAAIAWANVPMIIIVVIWIILLCLYKGILFREFTKSVPLDTANTIILFVLMIIQIILSVWSIIIFINALAQVEKYSIIRSIFTIIVGAIILFLVFIAFSILLGWIIA